MTHGYCILMVCALNMCLEILEHQKIVRVDIQRGLSMDDFLFDLRQGGSEARCRPQGKDYWNILKHPTAQLSPSESFRLWRPHKVGETTETWSARLRCVSCYNTTLAKKTKKCPQRGSNFQGRRFLWKSWLLRTSNVQEGLRCNNRCPHYFCCSFVMYASWESSASCNSNNFRLCGWGSVGHGSSICRGWSGRSLHSCRICGISNQRKKKGASTSIQELGNSRQLNWVSLIL